MLDAIELGLERARRARAQRAENQGLHGRYVSLILREREVMAYSVADLLNKQAAGSCGHELNDREKAPNPLKDLWRGPAPESYWGTLSSAPQASTP